VYPDEEAGNRRERLKRVYEEASVCRDCALAESRTMVVFGAGNADADLMFVGEAPGKNEDEQGLPFVGQAGKLLTTLLEEIGLDRGEVFIANTLKCRPPGNRDPYPGEIQACQKYLFAQIDLIQPTVIATLGNFATKLLRGENTGISQIHGEAEERVIGPRAVRLLPLYHPAAALYARATLDLLRADLAQVPDLLALGPPPQPEPEPVVPEPASADAAPAEEAPRAGAEAGSEGDQLGLF
jgi:uracil-DNA glycosylase